MSGVMREQLSMPCGYFFSCEKEPGQCKGCGWARNHHAPGAINGPDDFFREPVVGQSPVPARDVESRGQRAADAILRDMAATFAKRNAVYSDNYKMVAPMVKALFPNGVPPELVVSDHWHLFELILVKLARFAATNLTHVDSIHDAAIYAAMIESIITTEPEAK